LLLVVDRDIDAAARAEQRLNQMTSCGSREVRTEH
jgi:hypothetical protein